MNINDIMINVKRIRLTKNWTQKYIADGLNVTEATYGRYESGDINIKLEHLIKISDLFDLSIDEIINYDPDNSVEKKRRSYDQQIKEADNKIILLEQKEKYLAKEIEMLRELTETKSKYLKLLEEKLKHQSLGGADSASFDRRAV